jgi:hypothetical protein
VALVNAAETTLGERPATHLETMKLRVALVERKYPAHQQARPHMIDGALTRVRHDR